MTRFFIDPTTLPDDVGGFVQVISLCVCYAVLVHFATSLGLIGGSRLMLLSPRISSFSFNTIIPVVSSIPITSLILASGTSFSQNQLDLGMGTLVGSTISNLSLMWFISVLLGRVTLSSNDELHYAALIKLTPPGNLDTTGTGVSVSARTKSSVQMTLLTASSYLFILLPGMVMMEIPESYRAQTLDMCAFVALLVCVGLFFTCMWYHNQTTTVSDFNADEDKVIEDVLVETIQRGQITLKGAMYRPLRREGAETPRISSPLNTHRHRGAMGRLRHVLEPFHQQFSDANGVVDLHGLCSVLRNLGEVTTSADVQKVLTQRGRPSSGHATTYDEFVDHVVTYLVAPEPQSPSDPEAAQSYSVDGSESPPLPLGTTQQQDYLMLRAVLRIAAGVVAVAALARPLVEVMYEISNRTGWPPFTTAFILGPIICDSGARVHDVFRYASHKTARSISICLTALNVTVQLNTTLAFAMFVGIMFNRGWRTYTYSAELLTVLLTVAAASRTANKTHQTLRDGLWALALYPLSLLLIAFLESLGFD